MNCTKLTKLIGKSNFNKIIFRNTNSHKCPCSDSNHCHKLNGIIGQNQDIIKKIEDTNDHIAMLGFGFAMGLMWVAWCY